MVGLKPSGKFAALLVKRGVFHVCYKDGSRMFSKNEVKALFIPRVKPGECRPDSAAYIDQCCLESQRRLPLPKTQSVIDELRSELASTKKELFELKAAIMALRTDV